MKLQANRAYPIAAFTLITILLIAVFTAVLLWDIRKQELNHTQLETIGLTKIFTEQTERTFTGSQLILQGIRESLQTTFGNQFPLDSLEVHLLLGTRVMWMRQIDLLYLVDETGIVVNSSAQHPSLPVSMADREYFTALKDAEDLGMFIERPRRHEAEKDWVIHLATKLLDTEGRFKGVVVAVISTAHIEDGFNLMRLDYARPVALYRTDGTLIASTPRRTGMIGDRPPELGDEILPTSGDDIRLVSHVKGADSREEFTLASVNKFPLVISVTNDEDEAMASWREAAIPIICGAIVMSLLIMMAAFLLIRKTLREADLSNALGESKSMYQLTIDSMMDAIVVIDSRQNIVLFNPAAEKMFGRSADSMLGRSLSVLIPAHVRTDHSRHVARFQHSATPSRAMAPFLSITGLHANGTLFPIESTISQTIVKGEAQLTAVLRDMTDRQLAERELKDMNDELALLLVQREDIRENERTRISLELHDELGQRLTGLKLDVAWLSNRIKDGRIPEQDKIDALRAQIDQAISSVRRISIELRPIVFDELDFDSAVAWQVQEFKQRTGVEVALSLDESSETQIDTVAHGLFRIVQESLTNIARHAKATQVDITLRKSTEALVLSIRDNGQGMAIESTRKGLGVIGMRERAKALGAKFTFTSEIEKGTSIRIELPLDAAVFSKVAI